MTRVDEQVRAWLEAFARAVRGRDFPAGQRLFAPEVVAYGTVCRRADGLAQLEQLQWRQVWPVTRDFDFDYDTALSAPCGPCVVVLAEWYSQGCAGSRQAGERRGRSTILLRASPGGYRAVHTHFSLNPS